MIDLIGFWTSGIVTYAHTEDEGIYFDPDGTGFITWSNLFVATFDTFTWSIDKGLLSLKGIRKYILYHGDVSDARPSEINECSLMVKRIKSKSLDDDIIDSLVFPETSDLFTKKVLGLICDDIWGIEHFNDLKKILSGDH